MSWEENRNRISQLPDPGLVEEAFRHVRQILTQALEHNPRHQALLVYDKGSELALVLAEAYRKGLPDATLLDFETTSPEAIRMAWEKLRPNDLVVLIQSTNFRLEAFRLRVELFKRSLKVVEHMHLDRMRGEEARRYVAALAYDPGYYRGIGHALRRRIDRAETATVDSGGETLVFASGFEPAKANIGDYAGMKNIGGLFPIGEVFTEARDLRKVQGRLRIFAFADTTYQVNKPPDPMTLIIQEGKVAGTLNATPEFEKVLNQIRSDEGDIGVRELGFGMNRAFTREWTVSDIGAYERMCGIHLSLGAKHAIYPKPGFKRKNTKHHVDVFAITDKVYLDRDMVFSHPGGWIIPP